MSTRAILRALVVVPILAACSDPAEPPLPSFSVSPATQWSGGVIALRSQYFVGRQQLPVVVSGSDTLSFTRQDDSTLLATVPLGSSGPATLSLARGTQRDSLATVQRVGLREKGGFLVALEGELHATDSAGVPLVFGGYGNGTGDREQIVRVRVTGPTFEVLTLREPSNAVYGMAPSATPGVYAVRDSTDSLRLAMLFGSAPTVTGTVPWAGTGFTRQVARLSPGIWLFTNAHQSYTKAEVDSLQRASFNAESPWAVYLSPSGNRSTIAAVVAGGTEGVPVFDNATGTISYRLPLVATEAATFSSDGSALYAVGASDHSSDTLIAVNATTGALLLPKVHLPAGMNAMGVAYSSSGGGKVLVGAANTSMFAVLVYRANTLELLGVLPTGDDCSLFPSTGPCFMGLVTVDDAHDSAYLITPGSPAPLWTFDLLDTP